MKRSSRPEGFTIVETLIVLAVTGGMFLSAVLLISGRQRATEFGQGVRLIQSTLQQNINEVSSGYYSNNGAVACTSSPAGPVLSSAARQQGTNKGCVFLGKALQLSVAGTDPEQYNAYTIVGLANADTSVDDLAKLKPRLLAKSDNDGSMNVPDVYETFKMPFGLKVQWARYNNDASKPIGAVGFVSSIGSLGGGDTSQQVNVVAIPGTAINQSKSGQVSAINGSLPSLTGAMINPANGVQICVSNDPEQSGLLSIGGQGRQLTVGLDIKASGDCS